MGAYKRKAARDGEVIQFLHFVPVFLVVAVEARRWKTSSCVFVVVVGLVATDTVLVVGWMEDEGVIRRIMAGFARCPLVSAYKSKAAGNGKVIDILGVIPGINSMAIQACCREARACVFIIIVGLVAADAILVVERLVDGSEVGGFMARRAGKAFVCTKQVKPV